MSNPTKCKIYSLIFNKIIDCDIIRSDDKVIWATFTDWNKEERVLLFKRSTGLHPNLKKHDYQLITITIQ